MGGAASLESAVKARTEFTRKTLIEDNDNTAFEYIKVVDRVERFVKPEHGKKIHIRSIERVENPDLDRRLFDAYKTLFRKDCFPELLIHGTNGENAEKIIKEGFKVGTRGMFGAGIYFATDNTKSAQYCRDNGVKSLLLCEVLLGKTMVCNAPQNGLTLETVQADGYDSVYAKRNTKGTGGVLNDEYIVYRPEQAAPRYLVKFETSNLIAQQADKQVQCSIQQSEIADMKRRFKRKLVDCKLKNATILCRCKAQREILLRCIKEHLAKLKYMECINKLLIIVVIVLIVVLLVYCLWWNLHSVTATIDHKGPELSAMGFHCLRSKLDDRCVISVV